MATESDDKCRARELWVRVTSGAEGEGSSCSESTRDSWWRLIRQRYGEPSRHHHNLDHLNHMAELWAEYADHLSNPRAVALALFFQYLEYDPKSQDNEERCIEAFRRFAEEARIPTDSELYLSVTELIQLTKLHSTEEHKQEGMYGREDKHFFLDFDMCVLGSSPAEYKDYTERVRLEYSFVPDAVYKSLRSKIPNIFSTEPFRRIYEERAKSNIRDEIAELDT
ncbi:hypothetical protein HPB52_006748 [Rhipicephalus sanguineus]|uniref:Uncharacterized protein n=1 Tax=Rhipicephalus sanguineus TaxID=34632 RepID=A0A9D4PCT2_RHISA|nr:hypothetical protein HPB52_006748 [Rhipicephalus sanguineus]